MISQKMVDAYNEQIKHELFSAYLYTSMEAFFAEKGLKGFANWMREQSREEETHARKIYDYIISRGGSVRLQGIEAPNQEWRGILEIFERALSHEEYVTSEIEKLAAIAEKENDRASGIFLQWFITEQIEEESTLRSIIDMLKLTECTSDAIFHLDAEFSTGKSA